MQHCFYHNDLDGHCGGAIVKRANPDCVMHEIKYGYRSNTIFDVVHAGDRVIFVDFTPTINDMKKLIPMVSEFVWLDHHKVSIERVKEQLGEDVSKLSGMQDTTKAGCELAWEYYYPNTAMPMAVYHVGRWDMWDHRNNGTIPFNRGLDMMETDPARRDAMEAWEELFKNERTGNNKNWNMFDQVMNLGLIAESMKAKYDKFIAKNAFIVPNWHGKRTVALNSTVLDSYCMFEYDEYFERFDPEVLVWYTQLPNGLWKYSMRSYPGTTTDVSEIAKLYGGGGHVGSSGFVSKELLIKPVLKSRKWALLTAGFKRG